MSAPRVRLLVSGDLHVGRFPSRVPPEAPGLDVASVVRAMVDAAVERRVDAVILTGDLADEANKFYEAFGVLEGALRRLAEAGIPTFAVAGNHDHDVAGALADAVASPLVQVLGRGGRWEGATLTKNDRPVARLVGWSFPARHVPESPLATFDAEADLGDGSLPVVGLLHADLDAPGSPYAPVAKADLAARPVSAWLLGHVHAPRAIQTDGAPLVLYPGSPQPLDPGEPGAHGAWLVHLDDAGRATAEMLPLATVRYGALDVPLGAAATPADARSAVVEAVKAHAADVRDESPAVRHASVTVRLTGRTSAFGHARALADELRGESFDLDGVTVRIDRVSAAVQPALDLARLAEGTGPTASLARLALRLGAGDLTDADRALVARAEAALRDARRARVFDPLARHDRFDEPVEAEALRRLQRQTFRLLDATVAQQESG